VLRHTPQQPGPAMTAKRLVIAGSCAALVLGGTAVVLDNLALGQGPSSSSASTAAHSGERRADDGAPSVGGRYAEGTADQPQESAARGIEAGNGETSGTGSQRPLEVLPPANDAPTGLPMPSPPTALITSPLPAAASAQGKMVEGFPSRVITFPDGTVVVFTGVSSSGDTLQATAEGIVELDAGNVAGHFLQILQSAGFRSEEAPAAAGQQALRLTRGKDSVSLTLSATGTGSTRFSLLGNFHTEPGA
jgi:hypothetical protein